MNIFEAAYRKIMGRSPRSESSLKTRMQQMLKTHDGSVPKAAKAAGVSPRTWRRWAKGESKPKPDSDKKLTKAYRDSLVPKGRRERIAKATKQLRPGERGKGGLTITGNVTVSSDTRRRTLKLGQHLPEGSLEAVMNAILAGDDQQAEQLLNEMLAEYGQSIGGGTSSLSIDIDSISIEPMK